MPLLIVGIAIVLIIILISKFKIDAFFALLFAAFLVGILNGMPLPAIIQSVLGGVGKTMGNIILILVFGAMLGKLVEESGAAYVITNRLTNKFGIKNIQYVVLVTGFLVGLPMMYNASFLVLIPLIYTFSSSTKLPLLYLGIPLSATLSIAHGYLPPHPAPTYVSYLYGADINMALLIGLIPVIPACYFAGIVLSRYFKKLTNKPPKELFQEIDYSNKKLPGFGISIFTVTIPVILMLLGAIVDLCVGEKVNYSELPKNMFSGAGNFSGMLVSLIQTIKFFSDPNIALLTAVCLGIYTLGLQQNKKMPDIMKALGKSTGAIAMIIMIIAAGGAFSNILIDSGVNEYIKLQSVKFEFNPLLLGFSIAAIIRLAVGSATVACMAAAGVMLPIVQGSGIMPELMVLATCSGSLMFSHFNDIGFWMFKEYYNATIKQTFAIWTVMESIVAIVGLSVAMLLNFIIS